MRQTPNELSKQSDATLGHGFKGITGPDHTMIRNSFVVYMKNNPYIDYSVMVEKILGNYEPIDPNVSSDKILAIKTKATPHNCQTSKNMI